uniref:DUF3427 domain-containing protein n=1 Tax=uncultured marine thaumarchaeote KM3_06_C02 TaxID=1455976 RepID=A0A075G5F8_9ARCH|nr:hypothetical protein [uncultured marine thaumarchaeote KM3_06_C02]
MLGEKYSRKDLTKIFDEDSMGREGIFYCNNFRTIILFSDLVKERTEFTYNNYFEGDYFHWDSQRKQNINTPKIKEIIQKEKEVIVEELNILIMIQKLVIQFT